MTLRPSDTGARRDEIAERILGEQSILTVAVEPRSRLTVGWPDNTVDADWFTEVDYIRLDANFHDFAVRGQRREPAAIPPIAPLHGRLSFQRPDFSAGHLIGTSIEKTAGLLAGSPALAHATICIVASGLEGMSPLGGSRTANAARPLQAFRTFTEGRRILIHSVGDWCFA